MDFLLTRQDFTLRKAVIHLHSSLNRIRSGHLVAPPGDGCDHIAARGVPLHIRGHVVLGDVHHGTVRRVHECKSTVHTGEGEIERKKER